MLEEHIDRHISSVAATLSGSNDRDRKIALQTLTLIKLAGRYCKSVQNIVILLGIAFMCTKPSLYIGTIATY